MWNNFFQNSAFSSNISKQIRVEPNSISMISQSQYSPDYPSHSLNVPNDSKYTSFNSQSKKITQAPGKKKKFMSDMKNKIFIANLNYETTEQELNDYFSKFGNLTEVTVIKNRETKRPRGFGFLKYSESFMVDEVMKNRPHNLAKRQLDVKRMTPRKYQNEKNSDSEKIYISGFGSDLSEHDLRNYFEKYGKILNPPRVGMTMFYGFITFEDYDSVDKIILDNKHVIKGFTLGIQKSLKKDKENMEKNKIKSQKTLDKQFRFQPYKYNNFRLNNKNVYGSYQTSSDTEKTNFFDLLNKAIEQGYTINQNQSNFGPGKKKLEKF
ncbi:heterogeneous nuclear ribonucleo A1 [Brachionus plicatilis]|uniref:Heterogeneous nuclear ribonucleo A1 n=1 Tax=Brachionus plicatilis TaxID=10195 RepID=A0A3M7SNG0_BRAPC|nr:heterogeneous nuclear ribonucleo A1 [Brachionus plicatilis]